MLSYLRMSHFDKIFSEQVSWVHHHLAASVNGLVGPLRQIIGGVLLKYLLLEVANHKRLQCVMIYID